MGVMMGIVVAAFSILGAALSQQIADEFKAWTPRAVRYLLDRAARQLPEAYRARYREEWESHLGEVPGQMSKLIVAVGFISASKHVSAFFAKEKLSNQDPAQPAATQETIVRISEGLTAGQLYELFLTHEVNHIVATLTAYRNLEELPEIQKQLCIDCLIKLQKTQRTPAALRQMERLNSELLRLLSD